MTEDREPNFSTRNFMNASSQNLDRLLIESPDSDVLVLLAKLAKRAMANQGPTPSSLLLRDEANAVIGYLVPESLVSNAKLKSDEDFVRLLRDRIANPPDRFLNVDEFVAVLDQS